MVSDLGSSGKPVGKLPLSREEVVGWIREVVADADAKIGLRNTVNGERIKWSRIKLQAAQVGAVILKDSDLEDLETRLARLEEEMNRK